MGDPMSCDEIETLLAIHAVGELAPDEVRQVTGHLETCVSCQQAGEAFLRTSALLPLALPQRTPPAQLRNRLMAQVYAEAAGRPQPVSWRHRLWRHVPAGRPFTFGAGLAAAAVVALVAFAGLRPPAAGPSSHPVAVALHGTTAMPLANGELEYSPQTGLAVLSVKGLTPQSSDGTAAAPPIYQLWLIRANAVAVPAGVLSLGPDGHTWMAAMRMKPHEFQSLATTIEPPGGSSAPTGPEVLQAQLG
ncbi:MAG: anti-sigma factor domain-containing protein [Candidatus Dormibacteria bacterium]